MPPKKEKTKKSRKRSVYGTFGTLRGTRTLDLLVRSQSLYPTELAARVSKNIKMLAVCTQIDLAFRSQSLYPTELAARISKNIKMLAICTQIDLAVRSPNDKSQLYGFKPLLASFCLYVTPNYSIISMYS